MMELQTTREPRKSKKKNSPAISTSSASSDIFFGNLVSEFLQRILRRHNAVKLPA